MQSEAAVDLEKIVIQPTWREMLVELVASEQFDAWNIDIVSIADKYMEKIKELQVLELHVPANIILAASILLRFKSEALQFEEQVQEMAEEVFIEDGKAPVEIPLISLRTRIPPKRKATLPELLSALDRVLSEKKQRAERPIITPQIIELELQKYDIEEKMSELLSRIETNADSEGLASFSSLLTERNPLEIVRTLLPLLHLSQEAKVSLIQDEIFGEIFIHLKAKEVVESVESKGKGKKKASS
ncbi:segregation/condensation protein A [Candidatus Micrarchaeota archaeon]|nr:segregation/condensation protein A [Candidatus Micrarchaeota archaeon]